jgi:hypothetical protein
MTIKPDYDSIPRSYREYLELMQREGEFVAIDDEIDWKYEIGGICRHAAETLSPSPICNYSPPLTAPDFSESVGVWIVMPSSG